MVGRSYLKTLIRELGVDLDHTNISVALDGAFFNAYHDASNPKHAIADKVYWDTVRHMFTTAEPGFSVDVDENEGEWLRNAPVSADTRVLTGTGYQYVRDIVDVPTVIWTGHSWAKDVVFKKTYQHWTLANLAGVLIHNDYSLVRVLLLKAHLS